MPKMTKPIPSNNPIVQNIGPDNIPKDNQSDI
jgi:hypothetical protein